MTRLLLLIIIWYQYTNVISLLAGKLPVQVDTDWIPQPQIERTDPSNVGTVVTESSPPRIPPKPLELNKSAIHPVVPQLQVDNALPALPPKPNAHYS